MSQPNLLQRMNKVMEEIKYFQKEHKEGMRYSILSYDKIVGPLHDSHVKNGIQTKYEVLEHGQDGNRTWVLGALTFINVDNPEETLTTTALGYGVDGQDKGPGKAITYSIKTCFKSTYLLETGDDTDLTQGEEADYKPTPPKPSSGIKWVAKSIEDARSELWQWYLHLYGTNDKACKVLYQEYSKESVNDLTEEQVKEAWAAGRKADK